ncbi:hypothetical protein [Sporosarcina sp. HYO08]|uniref:hypothetical protein n=1 Tax=Sporosarcina sp. HYO08 TaxID=1759557 RepID=UPI000799679B|nr:hypothetical protein [Sporosarcina sp. HYO08]KXH86082.1 hypothetical protein AU377_14755 [Sporosarcina sp. HYO08]
MQTKCYIILGNNQDTDQLVEHLRGRDDGTITIIDKEMKGLRRSGDLVYAGEDYVESIQDMNLPFVYYHYILPQYRRDGRKWKRELLADVK